MLESLSQYSEFEAEGCHDQQNERKDSLWGHEESQMKDGLIREKKSRRSINFIKLFGNSILHKSIVILHMDFQQLALAFFKFFGGIQYLPWIFIHKSSDLQLSNHPSISLNVAWLKPDYFGHMSEDINRFNNVNYLRIG